MKPDQCCGLLVTTCRKAVEIIMIVARMPLQILSGLWPCLTIGLLRPQGRLYTPNIWISSSTFFWYPSQCFPHIRLILSIRLEHWKQAHTLQQQSNTLALGNRRTIKWIKSQKLSLSCGCRAAQGCVWTFWCQCPGCLTQWRTLGLCRSGLSLVFMSLTRRGLVEVRR